MILPMSVSRSDKAEKDNIICQWRPFRNRMHSGSRDRYCGAIGYHCVRHARNRANPNKQISGRSNRLFDISCEICARPITWNIKYFSEVFLTQHEIRWGTLPTPPYLLHLNMQPVYLCTRAHAHTVLIPVR